MFRVCCLVLSTFTALHLSNFQFHVQVKPNELYKFSTDKVALFAVCRQFQSFPLCSERDEQENGVLAKETAYLTHPQPLKQVIAHDQ